MAPNLTCRYCGTDPNSGEVVCGSERDARQCPWMGESDWKRYNDAVDKARALDAIAKARADERKKVVEECAKIAAGASLGFDYQTAMAECRDSDAGYNRGRADAAHAIRSAVGAVQDPK